MTVFLYILSLLAAPAMIILFFLRVVRRSRDLPPERKDLLDKTGMATSLLLAILYVPLSITGFFFGMIGESFIGTGTVLQLALCELIGILGMGTPVAAYGGLVVSLKLRSCEHSRQSFLYQFSGLVYLLLLSALSAIPFCL